MFLASIYLFINGNSKSELSRGGKAEFWNVTGITCEQGSKGIHPRPVEPSPQLCSEANDFFKVRHLGAHWLLNSYKKYNFEKAETSLGGRDRWQQLIEAVGFHFKSCGKLNLK